MGGTWRRHTPNEALLEPMIPPVARVVISYTFKNPCFTHQECLKEMLWIHKCHMFGSNLGDIRYNFLIGGDAAVYEGRGWHRRPTLPDRFQNIAECYYVGLIGRFQDEPPGEKMMEALRWLLKLGLDKNYLTKDYEEVQLEVNMPPSGSGHRVISMHTLMNRPRYDKVPTGNFKTNVEEGFTGSGNRGPFHTYTNQTRQGKYFGDKMVDSQTQSTHSSGKRHRVKPAHFMKQPWKRKTVYSDETF